jgi:hypothetical protein
LLAEKGFSISTFLIEKMLSHHSADIRGVLFDEAVLCSQLERLNQLVNNQFQITMNPKTVEQRTFLELYLRNCLDDHSIQTVCASLFFVSTV